MAGGGVFATGTGTGESGTAAVHTHCVCGAVHKEIGNHKDIEEKTFTEWTDALAEKQNGEGKTASNSLPAETGNYYLTENVNLTSTWEPVNGTVLCLNGKTITGDEKNTVIKMSGEFTLTDCAEVCGSITGGSCGVHVDAKKTFNMYNGLIKGNDSGVYAVSDFNMYSGVIKENKSGVYISTGGNFNMYGGSIIKNKTNRLDVVGVGVCRDGGRFTVSGNVQITGNLKGTEANNVYCTRSSGTISIGAGGLDETAQIGLKSTGEGALDIVEANDINYSDRFTADDAGYEICRSQSSNRLYFRMLQSLTDFNFTYKTLDRQYGDSVENQLNGGSVEGNVTYSSNNPTVARVDRTTGAVTIVGAGTAIIKTIKENSESGQRNYYTYYTLTVNKRSIATPADTAKTYNGQVQKCYENNEEYNKYVTFVGDGKTEANEAGYNVTAVLKDKENTQWSSDGTTDDKTFKFIINKADGSVTAPPAAVNNLVYNGSEQPLVTAGSGTGTMKYSLDGTNYSADVPKGKEAKTYTVYYKVEGDSNHKDTAAASINVKVEKAPVTVTADNKTINTGGTLPANSYTAEGLFGSDTLGDAAYTYKDAEDKEIAADAINLNKAGIYTIEVSGLSNNNYEITYATGTLTINKKSSGGTYKPPVQKPSITAGEGFKAELSSDGTKATITVEEGYEIVDVLVNGISKGKVTEITGLKTGDTIEVKTEKKQTEPVKPADNKHIIRGVKNTEIELEITVNKDGNIVIKWKKSKGYRVDSFEILRAVKKNGKYSKIYTTKSGKASRIVNAKNLKDGKRYYYKIRGVRTIDGKKYYTEWSNIESKKVKK